MKTYKTDRVLREKLGTAIIKHNVVEYKTKLYYFMFDRFFRYSRTNEYLYYNDTVLVRTNMFVGQGYKKSHLLLWLENYKQEVIK